MAATVPVVGVVSLSQGTRPDDLARGLASLAAQTGVSLDVVVVGNAWLPVGLPRGVRGLHLPDNLGIPAGRNAGADMVTGDYMFFLDDDASIPSPTFLADAIAKIEADPSIGLLQPRVVDPTGVSNPRRWIPRIRKGDPEHSSNVFSVWEGATLLPRSVYDAVGGWGGPYFYAHEGIELAWRVWDTGHRVLYAGDLVAHHPAIDPARHSYYYRLNARNRLWLAKRNLPWLLAPIYVASWTGIQLLRSMRNPTGLRAWLGGWVAGWRENPGGRRRIKWITVWRMARAGRPPLV
ncbi:MAG: glycosyltransferase family 2 protein [Salinibacterium sp.]|nr:glycosyltransferase family 2 protein [Salinibacterium sp.]